MRVQTAMMAEILYGSMAATGFVSAGMTIVAQTMFSGGNIDGILAGGVLIAVGGLIVRWLFRLLGEVRVDNDRLREQISSLESRLAEETAKYDRERQLRISLEEYGIQDRRHGHGVEEIEGP